MVNLSWIYTDTSNFASCGSCFVTDAGWGGESILAYYSRSLDQAEKNYCVTRKEFLAAVKAIRHFILICWEGRSFFVLIMRHYNARLINFHSPEGQRAKSLQQLQQYDYQVEYKQGNKHNDADVPLSLSCRNLWMQTNVTGIFMFRSY